MINNTYIIEEKSLKTVLDNIDKFQEKMETFVSKHSNYEYKVTIKQNIENDEWVVEINIKTKDEQNNSEPSKKIIRTR